MNTKQLTILIDPGHGGKDPGAVGPNGERESAVVLAVGIMLAGVLRGLGHKAHLTREADTFLTLQQRCDIERNLRPDCFISLHCNGAENKNADGIEVWTSPGITAADPLAREIFVAMERFFPCRRFRSDMRDGYPDKEAPLYVLRNTRAPAVLVEMGFITSVQESKWLTDIQTQRRLALSIADGLMTWTANVKKWPGA